MNKEARQRIVAKLLSERRIGSQLELMRLLWDMGLRVSQATLSRDLSELGAVRDSARGYVLPGNEGRTRDPGELRTILRMMILEVLTSGNLVVIKTRPSQAHPVAAALDHMALAGLVGTVAGDDTIIAVVAEDADPRAVAERILKEAGA